MNLRIKIRIFPLPLLLLLLCLAPLSVGAQNRNEREVAVCSQAATRSAFIEKSFNDKNSKFEDQLHSVETIVKSKKQEVSQSISASRQKFDDKYKSWLSTYRGSTSDKAKLAAADEFYDELRSQVSQRRKSHDAARVKFNTHLAGVRQQRGDEVRVAISEFKQASSSQLARLSGSCRRPNPDNQKLRTEFVEGLRSARLVYGEFRRIQPSYREAVKDAGAKMDLAVEEANKTFERNIQEALSRFREVDPAI